MESAAMEPDPRPLLHDWLAFACQRGSGGRLVQMFAAINEASASEQAKVDLERRGLGGAYYIGPVTLEETVRPGNWKGRWQMPDPRMLRDDPVPIRTPPLNHRPESSQGYYLAIAQADDSASYYARVFWGQNEAEVRGRATDQATWMSWRLVRLTYETDPNVWGGAIQNQWTALVPGDQLLATLAAEMAALPEAEPPENSQELQEVERLDAEIAEMEREMKTPASPSTPTRPVKFT